MKYQYSETQIDIPLAVVGLMALGCNRWDPKAPVRGWGDAPIGEGITVDSNHYSVTQVMVDVEGTQVHCLRLTVRVDYWAGAKDRPADDYLFPMEAIRTLSANVLLVEAVDALEARASSG